MTQSKGEPAAEPIANQGHRAKKKKRDAWGVRKLPDRLDRPNPYGVQWRERVFDEATKKVVSKPKTMYFPTAQARDEKYREQVGLVRGGMLVESVSREEIADFRAFKAAAQGVPWQVILAGYHANLVRTGRKVCTLKIDKAVEDYLAAMKALRDHKDAAGNPEPKLSADNYRHKDHKLNLFSEQFGDLVLDAVPAHEIETWIDDFDQVQSDVTFDNYVKHVSAMYGYYIERKAIEKNPCDDVKRRSEFTGGDGKIITPAQTAQLFHVAMTFEQAGQKLFMPIVGRLALEAFMGLRFSSGCRIAKSDINFVDKGVLLPKKKLKTGLAGGSFHYVDNLPEQVWEWLAIAPAETWTVKPREYMGLKSLLFRVANVPHPHNCLRHNFVSYDIAAHKNPGRTSVIICHKDQDLLWRHYFGVRTFSGVIVTAEMGKTYQRITPQTAEELARGYEPYLWPQPVQIPQPSAAALPEDVPLRLPA